MKVRLTKFQMNDGLARPLQFLRASKDGERTFAGHHGHAGSQLSHSDLPYGSILWSWRKRNAQRIHKARKEFKHRRRRDEFHNLWIAIRSFQFDVKAVI